jgi:hypothetical protein
MDMEPRMHTEADRRPVPGTQKEPTSDWHALEQPSPDWVLPSSQSSRPVAYPSPHTEDLKARRQKTHRRHAAHDTLASKPSKRQIEIERISPTLPSFPPPKNNLVLRDTLCSCEAYGMRPMYEEKNGEIER